MTHLRLRDTDLVARTCATGDRSPASTFCNGIKHQFPDHSRAVPTMRIMRSVLKANFSSVSLPLSARLATGWLALAIFVLLGGSVCRAQGTFTAASCNRSDVNAVINGPTHTAVNGDIIIIPAGTCTWTSGITITGVGIDITGTGTPNSGGGTSGAGPTDTTIIDNIPSSLGLFLFTGLTTSSSTAKVELLTLSASGAGANSITSAVQFTGTCTTSAPYCPSVRADNITFAANTWEGPLNACLIVIDDVFGVADHNTSTETSVGGSPCLVDVNYSGWQGTGQWGDNSFASADTLGTNQTFYIENNYLSGVRGSENDVSTQNSFNNVGGARYVCRFNTVVNMSSTGLCSAHGTAWTGRPRGQRQVEVYYNTVGIGASGCDSLDGLNAGVGYYFSNSVSAPGGGCNQFVSLDIPTFIKTATPWGSCNGTGLYDQIPFTSTSACIDQVGSGVGTQLQGATTPLLLTSGVAGWPNPALDPIYEAGEKMVTGGFKTPVGITNDGTSTRVLFNRDVYAEVSQSAQSSPTSPFNGTVGTGYGTLANRPTTCTPHVGYWATDQGNWNGSGSGGQGQLYTCTAANGWTMSYEPYTYPHPLTAGGSSTTGGSPNPPSNLAATVE
jgi:hypothetical protein